MKFRPNTLNVLAEMICGNEPYNAFMPYRSSSYLTKFFQEIDLAFIHDGSTRNRWVAACLEELNAGDVGSPYPPEELRRVILHIVEPTHFISPVHWMGDNAPKYEQDKAIEKLNVALKSAGIQVVKDHRTDLPSLIIASEVFASTATMRQEVKRIFTFCPDVFKEPKRNVQKDLVAVMMDFAAEFDPLHKAIKAAVEASGLQCERADDVWREPVIVQDIFELIFASAAIIVDFTGRNPNVMYETGIAHTLGKTVIPITQSIDDVPFDLRHYRVLKYHPNTQGLGELFNALKARLDHIFYGT